MDTNTEQVTEVSYDDALNAALETLTPDALHEEPADTSSTDDGSDSTEQLQQSESDNAASVENTVIDDTNQPAPKDVPSIDYKDLYEHLKKESIAHQGLLYTRLNDLSEKYQDLKQTMASKEPTPQDDASRVLEEFKEVYPDIHKAVELLLQKEVSSTKQSVESLVQNSVQPIREHIKADTRNNYVQRISTAHPDVFTLIDSGALRQWADNITDPVKQMGAYAVMQQGNAEQVISLISDYKSSLGTPPSPQQTQQTIAPTPRNASTLSTREEEIAKRVAQMISVPSKTPGMNVHASSAASAQPTDYDAELNKYMQEWEKRNITKR